MSGASAFKIAQSVLVVIYTPALDVLLIRRADAAEYWQPANKKGNLKKIKKKK